VESASDRDPRLPSRRSSDTPVHDPEVTALQRLLAEFIGTFFLTLGAAGPVVAAAFLHRAPGETAVPAGLTVMAIILALGEISGAHLNPAVTIAFAVRGDFPWDRVPGYLLGEFAGAITASACLRAFFGTAGALGVNSPTPMLGDVRSFGLEVLITVGLVTVILGTASRARNVGGLSAIAIGGYVALAGLWADHLTGASMNPARSLGPALVAARFTHLWIYLLAPITGALISVVLARGLRGPGGQPASRESAQGDDP
jgi:aquaporin Z